MTTYHHPYRGPGPDHHPLFDHDLVALLEAYRTHAGEFFECRSIERRVEQAVPGMVAPAFLADRDTTSRARRAVHLFRHQALTGEAQPELRALLEIQQAELALHSPLSAA